MLMDADRLREMGQQREGLEIEKEKNLEENDSNSKRKRPARKNKQQKKPRTTTKKTEAKRYSINASTPQ